MSRAASDTPVIAVAPSGLGPFRRAALAIAVCAVACRLTWGTPNDYQIELLSVQAGCESYSLWHGLAASGRALAVVSCDDFATQRAVVWDGRSLVELPGLGGPNSFAYGLDSRGRAIGTAETPEMYDEEYHVQRAVVWDGGVAHDLGTLGGPLGAATASNTSGTIVGACQPADEDPSLNRRPTRACVWQAGEVWDLGDLGGSEAVAYDISDRGWIVGSSTTSVPLPSGQGFEEHALLHDGRSIRDLGTLGGAASLAWALNSRGEVVGFSYTGVPEPSGGISFHAFVWRSGVMRDLGTLGGTLSEAFDINGRGDIVGWSRLLRPSGNSRDHAVLWRGERILDLNDMILDAGDCVVTRATAINDGGQILANATCGYWRSVVLLTPVGVVTASDDK